MAPETSDTQIIEVKGTSANVTVLPALQTNGPIRYHLSYANAIRSVTNTTYKRFDWLSSMISRSDDTDDLMGDFSFVYLSLSMHGLLDKCDSSLIIYMHFKTYKPTS